VNRSGATYYLLLEDSSSEGGEREEEVMEETEVLSGDDYGRGGRRSGEVEGARRKMS